MREILAFNFIRVLEIFLRICQWENVFSSVINFSENLKAITHSLWISYTPQWNQLIVMQLTCVTPFRGISLIQFRRFFHAFPNFYFLSIWNYVLIVKSRLAGKLNWLSFSHLVGWHHYNFSDQLYHPATASTPLYHHEQQPDSTSSTLHQQASEDVTFFNNSADSSDYVTTTSNHSFPTPGIGNLQGSTSISFQQRRGSLQLWQFLIALLDEPSSK